MKNKYLKIAGAIILAILIISLMLNWKDAVRGFEDGWNGTTSNQTK
jgi:hypothetical protein